MILEEVMNINYNNTINLNEMACPLEEYLDLVCEQCNDILEESVYSDLKIKKEDILDPKKFKDILNKLEKDAMEPHKKLNILFNIFRVILTLFITVDSIILFNTIHPTLNLTRIIVMIIDVIGILVAKKYWNVVTPKYEKMIKDIDKSIKKLEKSLEKEDDPKKVKEIKERIKILDQARKKLSSEWTKIQSKIKDRDNKKK